MLFDSLWSRFRFLTLGIYWWKSLLLELVCLPAKGIEQRYNFATSQLEFRINWNGLIQLFGRQGFIWVEFTREKDLQGGSQALHLQEDESN